MAHEREGEGGASQVGRTGPAGDTYLIHFHGEARDLVQARTETCSGDGVGGDVGPVKAHEVEVVAEGVEGHVNSVGNKAEDEAVALGEEALENIVVPRKLHGATVAEVRDHGEASVACGP